jgi:hypothetical protein
MRTDTTAVSDPAANLDPAAMTTAQVLEAAELERAHSVVADAEAGEMALGALSWAASTPSDTVEHHPDVLVNRGESLLVTSDEEQLSRVPMDHKLL